MLKFHCFDEKYVNDLLPKKIICTKTYPSNVNVFKQTNPHLVDVFRKV